jgi:hypothetical protein
VFIPFGIHYGVQLGISMEAVLNPPLNPHDILAVLGEKDTSGISGQRNPGSLPLAGRGDLRQAH